jgi:DNA-binding HxlR family transcriptional regulator
MSHDDLVQIQYLFGPNTDIPTAPKSIVHGPKSIVGGDPDAAIAATVNGRPVTRKDIESSLGIRGATLSASLRRLKRAGRIKPVDYSGKTFYELA